MTNKIEISRELADRLTKDYTGRPHWDAMEPDRIAAVEELRALLAAPAVERQEPAYYRVETPKVVVKGIILEWFPAITCIKQELAVISKPYTVVEELYTSPPAPVAVVLDEQAEFEAWYADDIGLDAYEVRQWRKGTDYSITYERCRLAWAGWQARARLDKVKELNP